jgi:tyrosine-protein kinase Etk/Wzc
VNPPNTNGANGANGAGPYAPPGAAANGAVAPGVPLADRLPPGWSIAPAPRRPEPNPADESVDVGRLARTVARGWRALALGGLLGVLAGLAVALLVRPWYRGAASVLVRNANDPAGSLLSRFGLAGDVAGAAAGGALGGVLKSSLETEVQLLQSRELAGMVVDSLALQARVLEPRGVPARALFAPGPVGGAFRRRVVDFARQPDGAYRAASGDSATRLVPGRPGPVAGVGAVTLAAGPLPPAFRVRFEDREDAVARATERLSVEKLGGDVVKLRFSGPDSLTAAAVPNAVIAAYLELRRTVDRGLNARRYEFMAAQADTAARQLAAAEDALRRDQERSGVIDPELSGKSGLEAIQEVRNEYVALEAERRAANALVDAVERGALGPRQLAAFPSFLKAPAVNSILDQITRLETERTRLLGTRTERDPDVRVLTTSIADLERGLLPLARTYAGSLDRQTRQLAAEQGAVEARLAALPGQAESGLRLQRDVKRLSQVVLGLQAQMIDTRLAALGEGGQVRQVDVAAAPKRPLFPRAVHTLPGGLLLGLVGGAVWAIGRGAWSSRVRSTADAERASGVVAVALRPGAPLLLGAADAGTVVVVGAGGGEPTRPVAEALAAEARARGRSATVVGGAAGSADGASLRAELERAEAAHDVVYLDGPALDDPGVAAVLDRHRAVAVVAAEGVTTRGALAAAADTLGRLGVPVLGVVVAPRARR